MNADYAQTEDNLSSTETEGLKKIIDNDKTGIVSGLILGALIGPKISIEIKKAVIEGTFEKTKLFGTIAGFLIGRRVMSGILKNIAPRNRDQQKQAYNRLHKNEASRTTNMQYGSQKN